MKNFNYDKELDAAYIAFRSGKVDRVEEPAPGIQLEYDVDGNLIGVELLRVSQLAPPRTVS